VGIRLRAALLGAALACLAPALAAQEVPALVVDSLVVEGASRVDPSQVLGTAGIPRGGSVNYRDIQRAITSLMGTGQFDDVVVEQREAGGLLILVFKVTERPVLQRWSVRGTELVSSRSVREQVKLIEGRPLDRSALARGVAAIDSLYRDKGYYGAQVKPVLTEGEGGVRLVIDIVEGSRVAVSRVEVEGNQRFSDEEIVGKMATKPEGFWWFRKGEYDEDKLEADLRERLPAFYASKGLIDFQVTGDSLVTDPEHGKATLLLTVEEGDVYRVGTFDVSGNRRFSTVELAGYYPFGRRVGQAVATVPFDRGEWTTATENVRNLYTNNGYIYAQVEPEEVRRTLPDGTQVLDLKWTVREGPPATVNKIVILGNDVTHERVIRQAIVMAPGMVFSRDALMRSYQNISNLGFFAQPLPPPDVQPTGNGVDVDITFRVEEKRTGNINFGASLGQGTGLGGFIGVEEPNLFGRAKRGRLMWQFGRNINDFTLSYTDPAINGGQISGTVSLFNSRQRYTVGDLGRRRQQGGLVQLGFPFLGARYTRFFVSYGYQRIKYTEGSADLRERFACASCVRSTVGLSLVRDTRVGLPFATGGTMASVNTEFNGGPLGGTGDYRKLDLEGRWYTPLGSIGGQDGFGEGVTFVLGLRAQTGVIFGDAGPFYTELYSMGGTQYGIPLRGYEEFAITPDGFDALAGGSAARPESFGNSYAVFSTEAGARMSQSLYFSLFFDAGNVFRTAGQWDPTRLYRGAGVGVALISPLGPLGLDVAYGFDRVDRLGVPDPGWKLHFKLGNFF
jgi:outer membrane protein insertion porin family